MTVGALLARCLRAAGAQRLFGPSALSGDDGTALRHVEVHDHALAALLADADGRIGPGPGVAWDGEGALRMSARPDGEARTVEVHDASAIPLAVAQWGGDGEDCIELRLELELGADAPSDLEPLVLDVQSAPAPVLDAGLLAAGPVLIAGPGLLRAPGGLAALHDVAARLGLGVLNTFGAKGIYRWDDEHHHGTIGLQERDGALAGLQDAPLALLVGVDRDELPAAWLDAVPTLEVAPDQLAALALRAPIEPPLVPSRPALYDALAAALGPRYASDDVPLAPARAAADVAAVLPPGGLVAADPGPAGLWVARALPTVEPGSVVVPATGRPGVAVALAIAAALRGRAAIAIATAPLGERTSALLDLATVLELDLVACLWGVDATLTDAAAHASLLADAFAAGGVRVVEVPVALDETRLLVEVAGPVAAWAGRQN